MCHIPNITCCPFQSTVQVYEITVLIHDTNIHISPQKTKNINVQRKKHSMVTTKPIIFFIGIRISFLKTTVYTLKTIPKTLHYAFHEIHSANSKPIMFSQEFTVIS